MSLTRVLVGISKASKTKVFLTEAQQASLIARYAAIQSGDGSKGSVADLAKEFGVNRQLPQRLFDAAKSGEKPAASRKGVGGRPPTIGPEEAEMIESELRAHGWDMSYAELEQATGISSSVIHRWYQKEVAAGRWRTVGKGYRPLLSDQHRSSRLSFAKENKRNKWFRHVDIDEKWFYATSMRRKLKVPVGTPRPTIPVTSKRYIPKVMVLTAIARPSSKHNFDGKVGCWRVCDMVEAQRNSKNHKRGDLVAKDVNMDGPKFRKMMIQQVFKAIREKMSWADQVTVQFDNARPHTSKDVTRYLKSACNDKGKDGKSRVKISILDQPAQSPDTNCNDLGFYASLDSQMPKRRSFNVDKLYGEVRTAWAKYPSEKLHQIFDTKSAIMEEIIKAKGDNDFKLPHKKDRHRFVE